MPRVTPSRAGGHDRRGDGRRTGEEDDDEAAELRFLQGGAFARPGSVAGAARGAAPAEPKRAQPSAAPDPKRQKQQSIARFFVKR